MSREGRDSKPSTRSASKVPRTKPHEYSPKIAERRRSLFPENNNNPDDLMLDGMTPIAETSSDDGFSPTKSTDALENKKSPTDARFRTVLFPNAELSIPPKTFYNSSGGNISSIIRRRSTSDLLNVTVNKISPIPSRPHPRYNRRSKLGEINAGVRHAIRKPKKPDVDRKLLLKAAENILDNSPLNDFLGEQKQTNPKPVARQSKSSDPDDAALCEYIKNLDEFNITSNPVNGTEISSTIRQIQPAILPSRNNNENGDFTSKKRSPSPLPETEQNRKFFKSARSKSLSAIRQFKPHAVDPKLDDENDFDFGLDTSDIDEPTNELPSQNMDAILNLLEDKENVDDTVHTNGIGSQFSVTAPQQNANTLQTSPTNANGTTATNGINPMSLAMPNHSKYLLMSPTTQMCDMTSILAINSPKRAKNLTSVINGSTRAQETSKTVMKKFRSISKDQMLLDAGQKNFGVTQCHECKFVYHLGDPDDEIMHIDYHNGANVLRFSGWKNERIVQRGFEGARILHILPPDPKPWKKKIKALLEIVNRDLGFFDMSLNIDDSQVFIYVKDKMIIGCLVAGFEPKARRMVTDPSGLDLCSEEQYAIKCGISRIWVSEEHRNKKIATALMDCLKRNFMHGYVLNDDDIAFSSPSDLGKQFARTYFKTPNFLIYGV